MFTTIVGLSLTFAGVVVSVITCINQIKSRQINKKWDIAVREPTIYPGKFFFASRRYWYATRFKKIIMNHLHYSADRYDAGTFENINIHFYLDLMEAAVNQAELKIMARNMAYFIRETIKYDYHIIAVPKNGNPLLAFETSKILKKRLLMVKYHATRRAYKFDGEFNPEEKVILIDDVSSDGPFLCKPVSILKENKIEIKDCLVLVHRREGSADDRLRQIGINLHRMCELEDGDIARLLGARPYEKDI